MPPPTAALNAFWADLLVEELRRQGVCHVALSPGSRSTPLALAVVRSGIGYTVCIDERGAAFLALGAARATGQPAAFVCTSGTAVANAMPAVVEAGMDGVPLLLLTADRPAELRHTGANQTVDQVRFFGHHVRWAFDLPAPDADVDPAFVLTTAGLAVRHATHAPAGPVHLNIPFREPLAMGPDDAPVPDPPHVERWRASGQTYTTPLAQTRFVNAAPLVGVLDGARRGLVVLGQGGDPYQAYRLADRLGWPLLPDLRSDARLGADARIACPHYDLVLTSGAFADAHRPDAVVQVGRPPVSKRLATFLAESRPAVWVSVTAGPERLDPAHAVTHHVLDPAWALDDVVEALDEQPHGDWVRGWRAASQAVADVLAEVYDARDEITEVGVARALVRAVPDEEALVVAASMPVRDVDQAAPVDGARVYVYANRGASGIDGTVATAAGVARGSGRGVAVLAGDLAVLHDLNSLLLLRSGPRVVVVVVNNDGGGIFSFLPVAAHTPRAEFEAVFGTPHGRTFADAAALFGLEYRASASTDAFQTDLSDALARDTSTLIEIRTERSANHALHLDVQARVIEAVEAALR